jgi:signal transduction histidine kinase
VPSSPNAQRARPHPDADRPSRTEPGSGLGLAIVEQAVRRDGGQVWAADRPDPDASGHHGAAVGFAFPGTVGDQSG